MSDAPKNRLTRSKRDGMVAGVCAGIANRYGYDVGLVRLIAVLLTVLTSGMGLLIYVAAWVLIPAADAPPPASMGDRRREFSSEVTAAAERAAEAAKIAAAHARQAADEIAAVARAARTGTTTTSTSSGTPSVETPASTTPPTAAADPSITVSDPEAVDPPAGGPQQP